MPVGERVSVMDQGLAQGRTSAMAQVMGQTRVQKKARDQVILFTYYISKEL